MITNEFLSYEKNKLYEDLAQYLIAAQNAEPDGVIGWAREANLSTSSCMNTAEVLLGLLYSSAIISQGELAHATRKCVKGAIKFLIDRQCASGGWTTSENNGDETAGGNIITSALAVWGIVEYITLHDGAENVAACLDNALGFVKSCRVGTVIYRFRPSSDKYSAMSTVYALIALANLGIYYHAMKSDDRSAEIDKLTDEIISDIQVENLTYFEATLLFLALKKIYEFDGAAGSKHAAFGSLYRKTENIVKNLTEAQFTAPYIDCRYVRENGTKTDFTYYTPIWVLAAISYGTAIDVSYRKKLIANIVKEYLSIDENRLKVMVNDREWTWASAQTLMAFSMYSSSQKIRDFFDIEEEPDPQSAFIVYGRNHEFRDSIVNCLVAAGIKPVVFNNNNGDTQSTLETVTKGMTQSAVTIVLFTGDDEGHCRKQFLSNEDRTRIFENKLTPQPRMNVIFEAGYSYGKRANKNTIIIQTSDVRPFSDIDGVNRLTIEIDKKGNLVSDSVAAFKSKLLESLRQCGCAISDGALQIITALPITY